MRTHKRLIAFLLLLGWLFATGHVALQHGGVANGGAHHALVGDGDDDDHDDDAPPQDSHHHHHDLTVVGDGKVAKCEQTVLAPVWLPLCDALIARLAAALRDASEPRLLPGPEHSPPDQRAFGWLLACRSALPVRGPSLA